MNEWIYFQSIFPFWVIGIGSLLLLSLLVWSEFKRNIKFLFWRISASVLLVLSIAGLLLQPTWKKEIRSEGIVLLTPHYRIEVADSLRNANNKLIFFRTAEAEFYSDATVLSSFNDFNDLDIRFVLGDGLPDYVLDGIESSFQYFKSALPTGIIQLMAPPIFKLNQRNEIVGIFHTKNKAKLKLINPSGVEDSVLFEAKRILPFKLAFIPRQAGLFTLIVESTEGDKITSQKLPVEVMPSEQLNILFLQCYPTAEVKFLKDYLMKQRHGLVSRSQLSKNNYRFEYSNHEKQKVDRLSIELLNSFDLIILDNETIESLTQADKNVIEESVRNGLGLVMLLNSMDKKGKPSFFSLPTKDLLKDTVQLLLNSSAYTFTVLPVKLDGMRVEPITQSNGRILSGYLFKGEGKIGFQLLQETYKLALQGDSINYSSLWASLIARTARYKNPSSKILIKNQFPIYPDEPIGLNIISSKPDIKLLVDSAQLPLREDVVVDDYFHGTTWAGKVGWHQFYIQQDSTVKNYYISEWHEWQSLRLAQQQFLNKVASKAGSSENNFTYTQVKRLSNLLFFLVFVLSAGFLWLVPKL